MKKAKNTAKYSNFVNKCVLIIIKNGNWNHFVVKTCNNSSDS
jgi:hypothetical protein